MSSLYATHKKMMAQEVKEAKVKAIAEVLQNAPEIRAEQMISHFTEYVNKETFKNRVKILWRVLRGKL